MNKKIDEMPDLTDDSVSNMNFFKDDLKEMYQDAGKMGELADKIDDDINRIYFDKDNRELIGRGIMPFVANQVKTLSELRSSKAMATNQILQAKLKISQLAINKHKDATDNASNATIAREFQALFMKNNKELNPDPNTQYAKISKMNDNVNEQKMLDSQIKSLQDSGALTFTDNEQVIKYESRGVEFKVSKANPHVFMAFAKDNGECLDDYPPSLLPKDNLTLAIFKDNQCICGNNTYNLF